jgi:hypothetical protein
MALAAPTNAGNSSCLPAFYIVGAMKAGTTTASLWLAQAARQILLDKNEIHFWDSFVDPRWLGSNSTSNCADQLSRIRPHGHCHHAQRRLASEVLARRNHNLHSSSECSRRIIGIKSTKLLIGLHVPHAMHACGTVRGAPPSVLVFLREPSARAQSQLFYTIGQSHWWMKGQVVPNASTLAATYAQRVRSEVAALRKLVGGRAAASIRWDEVCGWPSCDRSTLALSRPAERLDLVARGLYAPQMSNWLSAYGGCDSLLVATYEVHIADPTGAAEMLRRAFGVLGLKEPQAAALRRVVDRPVSQINNPTHAHAAGASAAVVASANAALRHFYNPFNRELAQLLATRCRTIRPASDESSTAEPPRHGGWLEVSAASPAVARWYVRTGGDDGESAVTRAQDPRSRDLA